MAQPHGTRYLHVRVSAKALYLRCGAGGCGRSRLWDKPSNLGEFEHKHARLYLLNALGVSGSLLSNRDAYYLGMRGHHKSIVDSGKR